jgi:hypothetical protein
MTTPQGWRGPAKRNGGSLIFLRVYDRGAELRPRFIPRSAMDTQTLLVIIIVVLLIGGGGWYSRGRWY